MSTIHNAISSPSYSLKMFHKLLRYFSYSANAFIIFWYFIFEYSYNRFRSIFTPAHDRMTAGHEIMACSVVNLNINLTHYSKSLGILANFCKKLFLVLSFPNNARNSFSLSSPTPIYCCKKALSNINNSLVLIDNNCFLKGYLSSLWFAHRFSFHHFARTGPPL